MKLAILALFALTLCGCSYARYPNGKMAVYTCANSKTLIFQAPGMSLRIEGHDPAITVQKYGAAVSQGIMSAGGSVATHGVIK